MTSSPPLHLDVSWVGDLIDHELGAWKYDTVKRFFFPHEADLIASIALSSHLPEDKMVWALTSNGKFSVRSAYHLAMEMAAKGENGSVSDGSQLRKFWKWLWRLNIPHKVRHFAWRACKDILSTKENLMHQKVLLEGTCITCRLEVESSAHLF